MSILTFTPPPVAKEFVASYLPGELFYDWISGPVGGAKTTSLFLKLIYLASLQAPSPDGVRRTRAVVVRNTRQLLRDTTIVSFTRWFRAGEVGFWSSKTDLNFMLKTGDIECELLFRPLDTAEDVHRVLSLEVTFALIDEFVHLPREIIENLSGRLGRWSDGHGTPVTNWGMWGASNTATEDNWWFDFLHDASIVQTISRADVEPLSAPRAELRAHLDRGRLTADGTRRLVRYFRQPGVRGDPQAVENVENLPGGMDYYNRLMVGKTREWIKQFIDAEWGYSASGKPVVPGFDPEIHLSHKPLPFDPHRPLVVGFDPGLAGTAAVIGQMNEDGQLLVLGEVTATGVPVERFLATRFQPYERARFGAQRVVFAPDPASEARQQGDGRQVIEIIRRTYEAVTEKNNRLGRRLDAIESFVSRLTPSGPALRIDAQACPQLTRALRGGWRYVINARQETVTNPEPEKNVHSHIGDGFGYLCRYFQRQDRRQDRVDAALARARPPAAVGTYALR